MFRSPFRRNSEKDSPATRGGPPAAFGDDDATRERLDWRLLQNGAVVLYHKRQVMVEDTAWLMSAGYRVYELDAARWSDARAFHADVKRVLEFPDYYGHNLAALADCLSEMKLPPGGAVAIQIRHYDHFARAEPHLAQSVLDALETTSRRLLLTGRRLLAQIQSDDPRIKFERVGAMPVNWNPREWLDSERGVRGAPANPAGIG
jgi:RNAse (barnase) inhibitor barstar